MSSSAFAQAVWAGSPFGAAGSTGQAQAVKDAVLYRALRLAQVTRGPGRTANPEQFQDALIALNGLIDSLQIQRDVIYHADQSRYTLTPSKTSYTIGIDPTGMQTADFAAPAPVLIEKARLVLTGSPTPVYLPLTLATPMEWSDITTRQIASTIPQVLYPDYGYPIMTLWFWPYPTQPNDVELWTWVRLTEFSTINDVFIAPAGYTDMLTYNLAVRLADQFGTVLPPNVLTDARRFLGRVKALNSPSNPMGSTDYGTEGRKGSGRGGFNYLTGM